MSGKHSRARPVPAAGGRPSATRFAGTRFAGTRPTATRPPGAPTRPGTAGPPGRLFAAAGGRPVFRQQAVESHLQGREPEARAIRLDGWWLKWIFWLTLVLVAAGGALIVRTPAGQSSSGPAIVDSRGGRFAILFPAAVALELPTAAALNVLVPGAGPAAVRAGTLRVKLASAAAARRAGFSPPQQPSILLTGRLRAAVPAPAQPVHTSAVLTMPSRSLMAVLGLELKAMLGRGGNHA